MVLNFLLILLTLISSACNTIAGFGEDTISAARCTEQKISGSSNDSKTMKTDQNLDKSPSEPESKNATTDKLN